MDWCEKVEERMFVILYKSIKNGPCLSLLHAETAIVYGQECNVEYTADLYQVCFV